MTLPEDMLTTKAKRRKPLPYTPVETHPGEPDGALRNAEDRQAPFAILGGTRWSETAVAGIQAGRRAFKLPVGCSFRRQMLFDQLHPPTPATSASASTRSSPDIRKPTSCSSSAAASARCRRPTTRCWTSPTRPEAGPCPSGRRGTRPGLPPDAGDQRLARAFAQRSRKLEAAGRRSPWMGRADAPCTDYLAWSTPPRPAPARCRWARSWRYLETVLPEGRHHHQRRRQLRHLDAPLPPLPPLQHAGCADLRLHGLRRAGSRRRQAAVPGAQVIALPATAAFLMNGQEFATAVQYGAADHRRRRQQRHVRHDPHASGARISRPRQRHRPHQPRFRRLSPAPMAATAKRSSDGGLRPRLRTRPRERQAGDHRDQARSGGDHAR
jgi:acetolactate synthase I/II/III large subunit